MLSMRSSKKRAMEKLATSNTNKRGRKKKEKIVISDDDLDNFLINTDDNVSQSKSNKCPFCMEFLPYPLPSKIHDLLNKIAKQNGKPIQEDRYLFCKVHFAETTIVLDGIQKGYPMEINFELLESRIVQMKDELLDIVNKKDRSNIPLEEARKIMEDSANFGDYVHKK
ncbi:hypothetical protein C1645_746000 [Glomus cerebriforme]|uniref:Restriction of telomere capping protein 4 n=1 Tax=Glomus cerebriforme TaxID=658196 RepID=A0A397S3B1_9GLOM|nr:hypothetical protein C1645_746000 [Glomus cerebriforme]